MVQLMTDVGMVLTFWGVQLSLATLMKDKEIVSLYILLILTFPDKNMFIWTNKFSYNIY